MSDFKTQSISSGKWNLLLHLGQYAMTFFLSIVLSRMISPAEFGLTGMLTIFISLATIIANSGLASALVFDKKSDEDDYSTVFYFNAVVSIGLYIILFFCAPLIALMYGQQELTALTRWISLVFVLNAFSIIHNTILVINLDFKTQSLVRLVSLFVSVIISIILALKGWGVYSIVAQSLIQALVSTMLFWHYSPWRPTGSFTKKSFKKLWNYGSKILYSNIFTSIVQNIDNFIIGLIFAPSTLGLFVRAKSTKAIPENIFTLAFQTSVFPILSKINDDRSEHTRRHLQFFNIGCYFIFPVSFLLYFVSSEIVEVLYGSKWAESVQYLKLLSFSIIPYFLGILFNQTLLSLGDSKLFMKLNMFRRVLGIINIPVAIWWGLIPYLVSIVALSAAGLFIDILYTSKQVNTHLSDYLPALLKALLISLFMILILELLNFFLPFHAYLSKTIGLAIGITIYILSIRFIESQIYGYFKDILFNFLNKGN